jgi:hypothetical protein
MRIATGLLVGLVALAAGSPAGAQAVYRGNDTGGIIVWSPENELVAREVAGAHCASYGKYARITSVHRQYGDYIAFNCLWRPDIDFFIIPPVRLASTCVTVRKLVDGRMQPVRVCKPQAAAVKASPR